MDGTGAGIQIFPETYGASIMTLPFGGFLTLGLLIALMQYALSKSAKKKEAKEAQENKVEEVEE
jgi:Na+-translocating ferredoxin:NAD+ oxidoreductase RnfE subunit